MPTTGGIFPLLSVFPFGPQNLAEEDAGGEGGTGEGKISGGPFPLLFWSLFGQQVMKIEGIDPPDEPDGPYPPTPTTGVKDDFWPRRNARRYR